MDLVSDCADHAVLKLYGNHKLRVIRRFRSVVADWTRTYGVVGSNFGEVKLFLSFSRHVFILRYTKARGSKAVGIMS